MTPRPLTLALASTGLLLQPLLASSQDLLPVVSPRFQTPILLAAQSIEARPEAPTAGSEAAAAYDPVGAAFKGLRLNASDWTRAEADALTITNALRSARDQRDGVKAQYGAAVDQAQFISRMGEAALILTGYTAVTPAAAAAATAALTPLGVALAAGSAMALKAGGDYMLEAQRAEFDTAVARAQQEYRGKIDEMAAWVAGRATHSAAAGESTVQAAARYAAELTNTQEFRSLDPEARAEVKRQLSERMLERLARGDVPSSQQTDALATKTAASAQGVAAIQKDVSTLERRLGANVVALEASTAATQAGLQALEDRMVTKVGQVQAQLEHLQYASWSQMSSSQKLEMLANPALLPDLKDREAVKGKLQTAVNIDTATSYVTAIGDSANLLAGLGVPINAASVGQGVNIAVSALNTYAAVLSGNGFAAISSLGKLVGGFRGGPDAETMRHKQLMKELQKVVDLQLKTLEKLDALSKQLATSTEQILAAVSSGADISKLAVRAGESNTWGAGLDACRRILKEAGSSNRLTPDGRFVSYAARSAHFNARTDLFELCDKMLASVSALVAREPNNPTHLPFAFWGYNIDQLPGTPGVVDSPWRYHRDLYAPMRDLHRAALFADGRSALCSQRMVAHLAVAPSNLATAYSLLQPCDESQLLKNPPVGLQAFSLNQNLGYDGVFGLAANPGRVLEVGQTLLALAPFQELIDRTKSPPELYPEARLPDVFVSTALMEQQKTRYTNFAHLVSVVLAQQTVLSGAMAAPYAVDVLKRGKFGYAFEEAAQRRQPMRNALAPLARAGTSALWTFPVGAGLVRPPQEFGDAAAVTTAVAASLKPLTAAYDAGYLRRNDALQGYCPTLVDVKADTARQAALIVCLMDAHPAFARNVSLALFSDSLKAGGADLDAVSLWLSGDYGFELASAFPGVVLERTGSAPDRHQWGVRLQHPDGREIFLPVPSVPEMEQGFLGYPAVAYPLMQLRETLLDRAAALEGSADVLPQAGDTSNQAQLKRRAWARQGAQFQAVVSYTN